MIVDLLLVVVEGIIAGITAVLPDIDLPYWSEAMGFADDASRFLFTFDGVLPMTDYVGFIRWVATVWAPGWLVFLIVKWLVAHLPFLNIGK